MLSTMTTASRWPCDAVGPTREAACVRAGEETATATSIIRIGAAARTVRSRNQRLRSMAIAATSPKPSAIQAPRL